MRSPTVMSEISGCCAHHKPASDGGPCDDWRNRTASSAIKWASKFLLDWYRVIGRTLGLRVNEATSSIRWKSTNYYFPFPPNSNVTPSCCIYKQMRGICIWSLPFVDIMFLQDREFLVADFLRIYRCILRQKQDRHPPVPVHIYVVSMHFH